MKADASRHKDECHTGAGFEDPDEALEAWAKTNGPDDKAEVYRCGTEDGKVGFEVRRQLPNNERRPAVKRAAEEDCQPLMDYKRRFTPGSNACCKPWVSFASATSLMVTWLPPTASTRFSQHTYILEVRERPDPASGGDGEVPWKPVAE